MYRRNGYDSRREQRTPRMEMAVFQELMSDGHVHLPGHDPNDPYSCTCYPKPSSITIPSMIYDEIRCPHPEKHHLQPAQDDVFAYPWTVQTFNPPLAEDSFRPRSLPPRHSMSAQTAPAALSVSKKIPKAPSPRKHYDAPRSAPNKKYKVPKLDLDNLDQHARPKVVTTPTLTSIVAADDFAEHRENFPQITQFDSVSQVIQRKYSALYRTPAATPLRYRDPDRNLIRKTPVRDPPYKGMPPRTREVITRDLPTRNTYYSRFENSLPPRARLTPPHTATMDPVPSRQFTGHYVDPKTGEKYKYDVRYGKRELEGDKRLLTT